MQSDSAEIKPAQCCIKLVFWLILRCTETQKQASERYELNNKPKRAYNMHLSLSISTVFHLSCLPFQHAVSVSCWRACGGVAGAYITTFRRNVFSTRCHNHIDSMWLRCILYIYSTNIGTEYFKHGIYSPGFFPIQNAVCFIILTYLVPVLFTFYTQGVLKLKKK